MKNITQNPYRILGVYANSPVKERVANQNRLNAFLRVGKPVSFPLDLPGILPALKRTQESVADAVVRLSLPQDQFRHAQFWFVKATPFDDIAFNHLFEGELDNALSIWEKKETASSLQNRVVCALLKKDYNTALSLAEQLYGTHSAEFIQLVLGNDATLIDSTPAYAFLDVLVSSGYTNRILPFIINEDWEKHLIEQAAKPFMECILSAIESAKSSQGKGSAARLAAGQKLKENTNSAIKKLKKLFHNTQIEYQSIADKLGLEILQCGIDYFNGSDEPDAAHKAMELQAYAQSVVVGSLAKERCQENVNILKKIIAELPPQEVMEEARTIKKELQRYNQLPDLICHAKTLLENCRPLLLRVKSKLGATNDYYLKTSTVIVMSALHNVIEEVNNSQKTEDRFSIPSYEFIEQIKKTLRTAWAVTLIMDSFDMESTFKRERYSKNREILQGMCEQLGISTTPQSTARTYTPPKPQPPKVHIPTTPLSPQTNQSNYANSSNTNKSTSNDGSTNWGCIIATVIGFIIFIISVTTCN